MSSESVYVETGACPGECCQYGRWRTSSAVALQARADSSSDIVARLDSGTLVNALTGAVHVRLYPIDTLCVGNPDARCQGKLLYAPVEVRWTRIETPGGIVGWSAEPERFDGMDACGVYEPPIEQGPLIR